jgi:membrane-associated HD superfamily phosphohydrolase
LDNTGILLFYSVESTKVDEKLTKEQALGLELDLKSIQHDVELMLPTFGEFEKRVLENFLINFLSPNILFDSERTQANLKEKLQKERNVYKKIQKGQIIARRGDLVTEDNLPMINAVLQNQKSITTRNIFSYALLNLLLFIFSFAFIHFIDSNFFKSTANVIFLMALYLVFETALDSTIETLLVVDGGSYGNLRDGMSIRNGNINYVIYQYAP